MKLKQELGLKADFEVLAHEALLNIYYTATGLKKKSFEFFRSTGITDVQFNLLMILLYQGGENGGLTQSELSRMMLVNRANITSLIDRMEKADLVSRVPSSRDRRFNLIRLTGHGRKVLADVEEAYMKEVNEIMGALKNDEMREMLASLEKIRDNLKASRTQSNS